VLEDGAMPIDNFVIQPYPLWCLRSSPQPEVALVLGWVHDSYNVLRPVVRSLSNVDEPPAVEAGPYRLVTAEAEAKATRIHLESERTED
jgi:hypothetical protein